MMLNLTGAVLHCKNAPANFGPKFCVRPLLADSHVGNPWKRAPSTPAGSLAPRMTLI
ncbi:MAG: hypothetical protein IPM17_01180 [Verrucomicrobia bacterium]|nr:hypothetical protein [Verrucomicrobiota bacterium]